MDWLFNCSIILFFVGLMGFWNRIRGDGTIWLLPGGRFIPAWLIGDSLSTISSSFLATFYIGLLHGVLGLALTPYDLPVTFKIYVMAAFISFYFLFECFGWEKWTSWIFWRGESWVQPRIGFYNAKEIWVDQLANLIVHEGKNYLWHCRVALFLRGVWWFGPLWVLFGVLGVASIWLCLAAILVIGLGFPVSCELARLVGTPPAWLGPYLHNEWEFAEAVHGLVQGAMLGLMVVLFLG